MNENICDRKEIETLLGFRIRNLEIYQEATLHKSAMKIYNKPRSNERLEFIGDSVLNLIIARYLFEEFPNENEGFLTRIRTKIVSGKCLAEMALKMDLYKHIRMNQKALKQNWNMNPRILEDVFESIIGAIYIDLGMYYAKLFVLNQIEKYIDFKDVVRDTNYKDILMRYTQSNNLSMPVYKINDEFGPNHRKIFFVQVFINSNVVGEGTAKNKKMAEQEAAYNAINFIKPNTIES